MVVFLHSYSALCYAYPNIALSEFYNCIFWDSLVRVCVPLFLIVNGITLLSKDYDIKNWLIDKIVLRLTVPYLFYGILYCIFLHKNLKLLLSPGDICYHFHFYSLILGLYILYPIMRPFVKYANKGQIIYFGLLFVIMSILAKWFPDFKLFNTSILLFTLCGGYPIIGYLLNRFDLKKFKFYAFLLYILCVVATFILTISISLNAGTFNEKYFEYFSPNIILMSFSIYIYIKYFNPIDNTMIITIRNFIEKHTYGIFFIHPLIQTHFYKFNNSIPYLHGLVIFICTFTITVLIFAIVDCLSKLLKIEKYTKYLIG